MDTNNWRPTQGTESTMDTSDWRAQLPPDSRHRIVNKIMDTLKRHLPVSGQEGLHELRKIAQRFEEKIYTAATSQSDYLRKISLKMLTMETKSQDTMANPRPSNPGANSNRPPDPGLGMQPQVLNPGQSHSINLANPAQSRQQLLSQNISNNITPSGVQSSAGIAPGLTPVSNGGQPPIQNVVPQQNISGQNSVGNTIGQVVPSNMFAGAQRQMPGRQQVLLQPQQQQLQNSQYIYQQQQLMKQKLQQGNISHQMIQSHMQQPQQQQNLLQSNQLQSSQQSVMQSTVTQSSSLSSLPQNQQSNNVQLSGQSMLQQHQHLQSGIRQQQQPQQASMIHQQPTPITQQPILVPPQQQQHMGQQPNATNMQHAPLLGPQNGVGDMHQQQRLHGQQNGLTNLQQQQQQLLNQQNNLSNIHQQQMGGNVSGLQQQQLIGSQSGNTGMLQVQQSKVPMQQQSQQNASNLLPSQGLQSQSQAPQPQMMPQIPSQPAQLPQQLGLPQQPNTLPRDMQQRLQPSGSLLQQQNLLDQQKQLYQSQRALPETSSTSLDSTAQTGQPSVGDWQEEVYQKIKAMKEAYLPEINEMYQKIAAKLQQHDSLPQQPKSDQLEKLKIFKTMLERIIHFLQASKSSIGPNTREKLSSYEKQIVNFINTNKPRKAMPPTQGPLSQHHMQSIQQPQSQVAQVPSHENQMNSQLQPNLQGSVANNMTSLQPNSMSSISGVSTAQPNMINSMQLGANLDSGQGNSVNSLQPVAMSSLQQNPVSMPQQSNINTLTSQGGVNVLQPNLNPLQSGSSMLQHPQLKQQQEQIQQTQQRQQFQQRPMPQQYMRQQMLQQQQPQQQQLQQSSKQQMPAQLQTHQMPQVHQPNEMNDIKMRQDMGAKPFQQHLAPGQRPAYPHQQLKPGGGSFPVSSPQLLQTTSPQIPQHSSPQVDQQNLIPSIPKARTPLQSANSPFVVPTPSPPLAPSPMPGDSEKPGSGASSITNAANFGHQHTGGAAAPAQSLAIGTPGLSPSPLLAEFSVPDGPHGNAPAATSGKSAVTEQPLERLVKAVKSLSPNALSAAVSDISSVVHMIDRIAGSAPGNGSRAAVGEDLVAMTNCRLQARNFITQDGTNGTKRMRRYTNALPLNVASSAGSMNDGIKQSTVPEASDLESTATSSVKKPRIEVNHALLEEIQEINQRLIDTVVDISDEDVDPTVAAAAAEVAEGTIVKCSFIAVALSPSLKSQYASAQMSPIQPLRLLVPSNYPNCSPILLDKFPVEASKENEDLSVKARSRFGISLRTLSEPMSLGDIARTWDVCARAVISEHAQQSGGGSFSSKYGTWENCLSAM